MLALQEVVDEDTSDVVLLERWRAGDNAAASALVQRHFLAIYRFFAANVRPAEAEDLTQRTFEACVVGRDRIQDADGVRSYLYGIARRLLATHVTRGRPRGEHVPASAAGLVDNATSPTGVLARADERELFARALARLSPKLREVLELFYWEDRSLAEIATLLGISVGTVKSRLHRARSEVAAKIGELGVAAELARATLESLHSKRITLDP